MSALLDTSILVDYFRKRAAAIDYMRALERGAAMSVVTIAELLAGARRQSEEQDIHKLAAELVVHEVSLQIAELAGSYVRHFGASHSVELTDAVIAATAEHHGLTLATLNIKHFPMFKRLRAPY